jgi:tRNA (guanine-N7-)-methyltransferase
MFVLCLWLCFCHLQRSKLEAHPMFDPVSEEELASDPAAQLLDQASEEAQKVSRNSGDTYRAVFRRRETPRDS